MNIKRPLKDKCPNVEEKVVDFIRYANSQRFPVTSCQVKACVRGESTFLKGTTFEALNSWLQKFLHHVSVQLSLKLHGKGSAEIPVTASEWIEKHGTYSLRTKRKISTTWMSQVSSIEQGLPEHIYHLNRIGINQSNISTKAKEQSYNRTSCEC